jgi:hypothetical protein
MGWFGKDEPKVPETISDDKWWQIQKGAARAVPLIDGPWVDKKAAATKSAWKSARSKAADN